MERKIDANEPARNKDLFDIKQHIVQIEAVLTYVLICIVAFALAIQSKSGMIVWAIAIVSLAGVGRIMRVRNPVSKIRDRILSSASGAASGIGLGLAIDTAFGFMTLGVAAATGGLVGGLVGAIVPSPSTQANADQWKNSKEVRRKGGIAIDSTPQGANIDVDGKFIGMTPSTALLEYGQHRISVYKEGFPNWQRELEFSGGKIRLIAHLDE